MLHQREWGWWGKDVKAPLVPFSPADAFNLGSSSVVRASGMSLSVPCCMGTKPHLKMVPVVLVRYLGGGVIHSVTLYVVGSLKLRYSIIEPSATSVPRPSEN